MWRERQVTVVVPAYNEEALIVRTLHGIPEWVDRVVLVDDASRDATFERSRSVQLARLVRIRHASNRGVGAAIATGYLHALREGADLIAVMAGDNQMAPRDLPALLDAVVFGGADYAKGNRFLHRQRARMPLGRRAGGKLLSWVTRVRTGLDVDDCQCGYTAITGAAASRLPLAELWPRYGYPNDLLLLLANVHARVLDVPVTPVYADEASGLHAGHLLTIAWRILLRHPSRLANEKKTQSMPHTGGAIRWRQGGRFTACRSLPNPPGGPAHS